MICVIQRVTSSKVTINNKIINEIKKGLNILVGINIQDTSEDIDYLARKIINLRIFDDEKGIMNKSIKDINGQILSISQFTLQANTKKGNRPSYQDAMPGEKAKKLYEEFNKKLNKEVPTFSGIFAADMKVEINNDGPVTIIINSNDRKKE